MKPQVSKERLMKDIHILAQYIDENGNRGFYWRDLPDEVSYVLSSRFIQVRQGILYYSTGHGWRVRKNPHWKTVYQERIGSWFQPPKEAQS